MKWDHKKIGRDGIYDGVPMDDYHGDLCIGPSVSSSGLRTIFLKSPKHYYESSYLAEADELDDEEEEVKKEAEHLLFGRAVHHLVLGEAEFSTQFVMRPAEYMGEKWQGNRAVCKAWLAEQRKAGRGVLTPAQIKTIRRMARSLSATEIVAEGMLNGLIEQSLVWKDPATGIWLKARPDAIPTDSGDFSDLKSTKSVVRLDLDRAVQGFRYDMQAALIKWGAKHVLDLDMQSFTFVFVEKPKPNCVEILDLPKVYIEDAEKDLRAALDTFAWCYEHRNWFGPGGTQSDARPVFISDRAREEAGFRRDFLRREIAKAHKLREQNSEPGWKNSERKD